MGLSVFVGIVADIEEGNSVVAPFGLHDGLRQSGSAARGGFDPGLRAQKSVPCALGWYVAGLQPAASCEPISKIECEATDCGSSSDVGHPLYSGSL